MPHRTYYVIAWKGNEQPFVAHKTSYRGDAETHVDVLADQGYAASIIGKTSAKHGPLAWQEAIWNYEQPA